MSKLVLKRRKPRIIVFVGTDNAAAGAASAVLSSKFKIYRNQKKHSLEVDISLAVIGARCDGKNIFKYLIVILKWIWDVAFARYPEILIFEFGDKEKACVKYLASLTKIDVAVVSSDSKAKKILVESMSPEGFVIVDSEDAFAMKLSESIKVQVLTYGKSEQANIVASHVVCNFLDGQPGGISFKLDYEGTNIPIRLKNVYNENLVNAALIGIATGIAFKINLVDIASALELFEVTPDKK